MTETTNDPGVPGALTERRGNTLIITINRPEARNAVNQAVSIGIGDALAQAQNDPEIRAVLAYIKSRWPERERGYQQAVTRGE